MDTAGLITFIISFVVAYYLLRRLLATTISSGTSSGKGGDNGVDIRANQAGVSDALITKLWETKEQITFSEFRRLIHTYNFPHHGSWSHDGYQFQIYQMFQGDVQRPCLVIISRELGEKNSDGDPIIASVYCKVGQKEEWQKRI
ncbi:MAG TPA: hypothetical protein PKZ07_14485 [Sedimentisphaerales bacterium]|nr:hypothetical protein [Sedimentisphaerales bacterium]